MQFHYESHTFAYTKHQVLYQTDGLLCGDSSPSCVMIVGSPTMTYRAAILLSQEGMLVRIVLYEALKMREQG